MENDISNDAALMTRLAEGDISALGDLVRKHQDKVLSLSYRVLGDWHRAEDIAQETFLRIYRAAKNYEPKARFTTWLYRIVINLCFDEQRRRAKETAPTKDASPPVPAESEYNAAERKEVVEAVKTAVNELPERQRLAVILHRYDGLSHAEIGQVTGWTKSAVESLLVRAYENLRKKLIKIEYFDE